MEVDQNILQELANDATNAQSAVCKDSKKNDFKTLFFLHQSVDTINFKKKIENATAYKEAWKVPEKVMLVMTTQEGTIANIVMAI